MTTLLAALALSLLAPTAASAPRDPAPAVTSASAQPTAAGDELGKEEFLTEFRRAMTLNLRDELERLVKRNPESALTHSYEVCAQIAQQTSEELEKEIEALRIAWKDAFDQDAVANLYEFFSRLSLKPQMRKTHERIRQTFDRLKKGHAEAEKRQNPKAWVPIAEQYRRVGDGYREVGDLFMAARCYRWGGLCADEGFSGEHANLDLAAECYTLFAEAREELDFVDTDVRAARERVNALARIGYGPSAGSDTTGKGDGGGGGKAGGGAATPTAKPVQVPLTFEAVPGFLDPGRPLYAQDELIVLWPSLSLKKPGSTAGFGAMKDGKVRLMRTGPSTAGLDSDGDGTEDVPVPIVGKWATVETTIGSGPTKRGWAFVAITGQENESYQDFEVNQAPSDTVMNVYVAPAGSMVGELDGVRLQVFDDNLDGSYGSAPTAFQQVGCADGSFQPDMDSLLVGDAKRAGPWSGIVQVGGGWYRLSALDEGVRLEATPLEVETGRLALDFKGPKPTWVVVRGVDKLEDAYFDVVPGGKKGIEVPVGRYELLAGYVAKGKRKQTVKALMLPGKNMRKWTVQPGETTKMELGGPFGFAFAVADDGDTVTVSGTSVAVSGRGGETYQRLWRCLPRAEASVRKAGAKKGGKPERLEFIVDLTDLYADWRKGWFPQDITLDKPDPEVEAEVQLTQKKNKLFGKVVSPWR
jgi:hypothetical protein